MSTNKPVAVFEGYIHRDPVIRFTGDSVPVGTEFYVCDGSAGFQDRVQPWMMCCFGAAIAADTQERNHRFLEEALELVQACGCTQSEAHQLVDYVFGRPIGEKKQEAGGVMVTLAALCLAQGLDMHECGETELARIWTKVEQIRAKQAAKPKHSPLPQHPTAASAPVSEQAAPFVLQEPAKTEFERCQHPACDRFKDRAGWGCRAMRDGACARKDYAAPAVQVAPAVPGGLEAAIDAMSRAKKLPVWDAIDHRLHIELDTIFKVLAAAPSAPAIAAKDTERLDFLIQFESTWHVQWEKRPNKPVRYRMSNDGEPWGRWHATPRAAIDDALAAQAHK